MIFKSEILEMQNAQAFACVKHLVEKKADVRAKARTFATWVLSSWFWCLEGKFPECIE